MEKVASSIGKVVHQAAVSCHKAGARNCSSAILGWFVERYVWSCVFLYCMLMTTHFHIMYCINLYTNIKWYSCIYLCDASFWLYISYSDMVSFPTQKELGNPWNRGLFAPLSPFDWPWGVRIWRSFWSVRPCNCRCPARLMVWNGNSCMSRQGEQKHMVQVGTWMLPFSLWQKLI